MPPGCHMPEEISPTMPPHAESPAAPVAPPATPASEGLSVCEPENALPKVRLADLPEAMRVACARAGWQNLLPMLPRLDPALKTPQALVLAPTRELAVQVEREAAMIFAETGIQAVAVYGGVGYKKQMDALRDGVQVIVGTPGRVLDHLLRRTLDLRNLRMLVFDEADRMLSIGFYPDMKEVQRYLPHRRIHTCLFSATYPPHVLKLAAEFMTEPSLLSLSQKEVHVAAVQHLFCQVKPMDKDRALVRLLETENPASALIFCNTKANVHYVTGVLQGFGYSADELSADISQNRREAVLDKIRKGRLQYLVATDVAARGIDIPALSHVFLYEPPEDHESYIHRAGRTGRAGAAGTVISLVDVMQRMELERIARHYKIALMELPLPTDDDVARVAGTRLTTILEARFRALTGLERMRVARYATLARELARQSEEDDDVLLLGMLLDACHQQSLQESRFPDNSPHAAPRRHAGARRGREAGSTRCDDGDGEAPRSGKRRRRASRRRKNGSGGEDKAAES